MKNKGKRICMSLFALLLIVLLLPVSSNAKVNAKKKVHVSNIRITKPSNKSMTLNVGSSYNLKVKVSPSKAKNKKVTYKSSNPKVVSVNANGKITAKKKGTARITVTSKDNPRKRASITVKSVIPVSKLTITSPSEKNPVIAKGKQFTIKTQVSPSNAYNKKLSYSSSNPKIASVNKYGVVTAKKNGKVTITVMATDGSKKKAIYSFTVGTPVSKVAFPSSNLTKEVGTCFRLTATVSPSNATVKNLTYASSNPSIATIDKRGMITCKKEGVVKITASSTDGSKKTATCTLTVKKKAVTPPTPSDNEYKLVWKDDFNGDSLNTNDWNYELHEPGWVNHELQQYTDSKENTYVKDGNLIIQAKKTVDKDGKVHYTSGRVNTQGKQDFKYGKFEIKAKSPSGKGFLPAIWMMPTDENLYGQWPKCGEIDIMEVLGHATDTTYGTLHFGEPHTQKQGSYTLNNSTFASEYHVYSCEWEPGEIRFYVDGILFNTVNDWFSKKNGYGEIAYPAPFDQSFYLIFNIAVGGDWPGNPDDTTEFGDNAQLAVDYVKVYQKDHYDENVKKPVTSVTLRDPDATGNYINNGDFSVNESLTDSNDWGFLLAGSGDASATISDHALHIATKDAGNLDYSVQVVQPNLPLERGYRYRLSFDALADEPRTMIADISGPDNGYVRYLADTTVSMTNELTSYSYEFDMTSKTDANGRVEFNLGNQPSTASVHIKNVRLTKLDPIPVKDDEKTILPDGNYVYNGEFQEGANRLKYWDIINHCKNADVSVTNTNNVRELKASVLDKASTAEKLIVKQDKINLTANKKYLIFFDAYADSDKTIKTTIAGQTFETKLSKQKKRYRLEFTPKEGLTETSIQFLLGCPGTSYLDNVRVQEDSLLINGDFSNGFTGFEVFTDSSIASQVTYGVDSLTEKNAASFDIKDTGDADWKIQLKQNNIKLEEGKWYQISFDAKSTLDRKIMYALQRDGSNDNDWTPYSGSQIISITKDYQTFTTKFQMTSATDLATILSISMGSVDNIQITTPHTVCIDNINLSEIDAPSK